MVVGEIHYVSEMSLLYDILKSKVSTWFQILQDPYVRISTIGFDVRF